MPGCDPSRIEKAWRDASDQVVREAARDQSEYPAEIQRIVDAEVRRRQLDLGVEAVASSRWAIAISDVLHFLNTFRRSHPNLSAILVGATASIWSGYFQCYPISHFPWYVLYACYIGVYVLGIAAVCWPLRTFRTVLLGNAMGCASMYLLGLMRVVTGQADIPANALARTAFYAFIVLSAFWVVSSGFLATMVWWRNRVWPVYPAGHCHVCGYNLYGLPEARCPECGTSFVYNGERPHGS